MTTNLAYQGLNVASFWNGQFGSRAWLEALSDAKELGANTIAITSTSYVHDVRASNIYSTAKTESLENVAIAVADAKANGMEVVLKPHIDVSTGEWRGRIDTDVADAFLRNYKEYILDYARMAEESGADILILATELDQFLGAEHRDKWVEIISEVRAVYSGDLTIAANWDAKVAVWDLVDIIGVNPYVALDTDGNGSVAEYMAQWHQPVLDPWLAKQVGNKSPFDFWKGLSETYDKPVMFTELGYRSMDGAAARPMDFWTRSRTDEAEQAQLYEAFYRTFANQDWVNGTLVWDWSADRDAAESRAFWDAGYTVEGKQAEATLDKWYDSEIENAATKAISVSLAGNVRNGPVEAVVVVDRVVVGTVNVTNALDVEGFIDYTLDVPAHLLRAGEHEIEVHFRNPGPDRGLHVDAVTVEDMRYEFEGADASKPFNTAYSVRHVSEVSVTLPGGEDGGVMGVSEDEVDPAIILSLAANVANGGADAAVFLDGVKVGMVNVTNTTWREGFQDYRIDVDPAMLSGGAHVVEVQFVNPAPGRGLHVDAITIGGARYEAEDEGAANNFVTAYNSRTIADVNTATDTASAAAPSEGLVLSLAANIEGGPAHAAVLVDGVEVGMVMVGNTTWREGFMDYVLDVPAERLDGNHTIEVKFVNPAPGRGLHVDAITVNGERHDVEGKNGSEFLTAYNNRTLATIETDGAGASTGAGSGTTTSTSNQTEPEVAMTEVSLSMAANVVGAATLAAVSVDGTRVAMLEVTNPADDGFRDYTIDVPSSLLEGSGHSIDVQFVNPAPGRGLHLDAVTIGGFRHEAEKSWSGDDFVTAYNSRSILSVDLDARGLRVVEGTDGSERVTGTGGADWIVAGLGADTISGGGGRDVFVIAAESGGGRDTITDYEVGRDSLVLEGNTFTRVTGQDMDGGTLVTIDHWPTDPQEIFFEGRSWWEIDQDFVL